MNYEIIRAEERGLVNPDWLKSYHTYSFGRYYDPSRMGFGVLRVVNDDTVHPGMGFDLHPHDNMEIVTIPLFGSLLHKDNMGNQKVITVGEVQAMSAGTGVFHSEENASKTDKVELLQIWIHTRKLNIPPNYNQLKFDWFYNFVIDYIVGPDTDTNNQNIVKIAQDAYFKIGKLRKGDLYQYNLHHPDNGVFMFVLNGEVEVFEQNLKTRDAIEIRDTDSFSVNFVDESRVLFIEIPMVD